jgi:hypothetical protein
MIEIESSDPDSIFVCAMNILTSEKYWKISNF